MFSCWLCRRKTFLRASSWTFIKPIFINYQLRLLVINKPEFSKLACVYVLGDEYECSVSDVCYVVALFLHHLAYEQPRFLHDHCESRELVSTLLRLLLPKHIEEAESKTVDLIEATLVVRNKRTEVLELTPTSPKLKHLLRSTLHIQIKVHYQELLHEVSLIPYRNINRAECDEEIL